MNIRKSILLSCVSLITIQVYGQESNLDSIKVLKDSIAIKTELISIDSIAKRRNQLNKTNMSILAGWAAVNILQSSISAGNATGVDKSFFKMNVYWNTVNLAIAGVGLYSVKKAMLKKTSLEKELKIQNQLERILLVNTALDIGYIFGGMYLQERGKRLANNQTEGFGKSIIVQGSFLLGFDIIQYYYHRQNGKHLNKWMKKVDFNVTENGVGIKVKL